MFSQNLQQLLYLTIPIAVIFTGGIVAVFWRPSNKIRSLLQHFSAGVIIVAIAVEVMPGIEHETYMKDI